MRRRPEIAGLDLAAETMRRFRPETRTAVTAVGRALELAAPGVAPSEIRSKGKLDVVTAADEAVEDLIRTLLAGESELPVVGEERGGDLPADGSAYWLVDPICGTRNFASGIPLWCVNVALVEDDRVSVGVVGDPSTGDVCIAERDGGAWAVNENALRPLRTSEASETVVVETGRAAGKRLEEAARFAAAATTAARWELRALSTTLALPYVAAGRVSAYVLFQGTALHTGAGSLLAAEAGALVSDVSGSPWNVRSDSIVAAATAELHEHLLKLRSRRPLAG